MTATLRGPLGLVRLDREVLTIGRSSQNRLVCTHRQLSSKHAEIRPRHDGRYQVVDVGSRNGTSVNGFRLSAGVPYTLSDGDTLLLGGPGGVECVFALSTSMAAHEGAALPEPPTLDPEATELPPPAGAPAPAPLPIAISNVARYKRPPKVWLIGGSLLLLVLVIAGLVLGGKVPESQAAKPAAPAATSTGTHAPAVIRTATLTIQGQTRTVLTNAQGFTLYYFTPDIAAQSACTGGCATTWPPLLFRGTGTPAASPTLPGTLSVQQTANGPQVEYNGHLLYTFSGDQAPGQANGQGKGGKWFVATPTLALQR